MSTNYEWHYALNDFNKVGGKFHHWMYEAKTLVSELPRLTKLFKAEREDKLVKVHQQCSMSEPVPVPENFLTCAMGVKCKECPFLQALEKSKMSPEELDTAKAYTCAVHLLQQPSESIDLSEGYILTEDDRMYWQNVYKTMSTECP